MKRTHRNRRSQRLLANFHHGLAILVLIWCSLVQAQVPHLLNYQGFLTAIPSGPPINTSVVLTIRLYNVASGGAALYTEIQPSVSVNNGIFNSVIGSVTPLALPFDVPYWLTVTINADGEMSPRQQVTASAYALRAATADGLAPTATVAGSQITGSISTATLPTGNLTGTIPTSSLSGTIASAQIANNAITQAKLSPLSGGTAGKVLGTDGTNLQWQTDASGGGTVTSVATGTGLSGGPITGSGTITLTATQLLPAVQCALNQIPKWNGAAWACAADDANLPGGNLTLVNPSTATTGNILKGANRFIHNFGSLNTFIGENAGNFTMTGSANTGSGVNALTANTSGNFNTASGWNALAGNTTGSQNTATGLNALAANTTGTNNTGHGANALSANTTGINNTASGRSALASNTSGFQNTASGSGALQFNTTGAANTALGASALAANTIGTNNTGHGANALSANTTGSHNTASGRLALAANTTGDFNSASGSGALQFNAIGVENTATGAYALLSNTTGSRNTANGFQALENNTSGFKHTAIGWSALQANTAGYNNTAIGSEALSSNTIGVNNTAIGTFALSTNMTGNSNIALGIGAGNFTNGDNNINIGNYGNGGETGVIRIGTTGTHFLTYIAGIYNAPALINGATVFVEPDGRLGTNPSSRRYKDDIVDMSAASNALMNLRPVTFHYKNDHNPAGRTLQYGLVAEEVAAIYPGLVARSADGQIEAVLYQFLAPMLLNEYQRLQRTIEAQAARIDALELQALDVATLKLQLAQVVEMQRQASRRDALNAQLGLK